MTEKKSSDYARILVQDPKTHVWSGPTAAARNEDIKDLSSSPCMRKCGCVRTSDKLKHMLGSFPTVTPPTSLAGLGGYNVRYDKPYMPSMDCCSWGDKRGMSRSWQVIAELVQLLQLSVTATALALYYLIYCYMQLVYYTLRSAMYFHNADGPMKITIGVVTVTSLIVGFNLMLRMERILGIIY